MSTKMKVAIALIVVAVVVVVIVVPVWWFLIREKEEVPAAPSAAAVGKAVGATKSAAGASTNPTGSASTGASASPTAPPPPDNYIKNGTFESPSVPADKPSLYRVPTEWTTPTNVNDPGKYMMLIGVARSGNEPWGGVVTKTPQYLILQSHYMLNLRLDETGIDVGPYVEQTVGGLKVGSPYYVSLSAMNRPNTQSGWLTVMWDDVALVPRSLLPQTPLGGSPEPYGPFKVTATKASHTLRIAYSGTRGNDSAAFVENVVVKAA